MQTSPIAGAAATQGAMPSSPRNERSFKQMGYLGFIKGMATGMVVGAAVTMMADPISDKQRRKFVKKTEGVFRNLGGIIDNAMDIIH